MSFTPASLNTASTWVVSVEVTAQIARMSMGMLNRYCRIGRR